MVRSHHEKRPTDPGNEGPERPPVHPDGHLTTTGSTLVEEEDAKLVANSPHDYPHAVRWPLLLIGLEATIVAIMIRNSYFYADDILTFGLAHQEGWRWSFIFKNIYGHIAPTERMAHLLSLAVRPMSYWFGAMIIVVLYTLLMLSLLWVLRELRVRMSITLTVLFVVGISTCLINETLYFDQTVFLLPASIFILSVTALFIRWTRTGSPRYLFLSWLVFAVSFITQERPLVVLPYLVLLRYFVLPFRMAPGSRRKYLGDWRIWLPFGVVGGAYVAFYLTIAPKSHTSTGTAFTFLRIAAVDFLRIVIGTPAQHTPWWVSDLAGIIVITIMVAGVVIVRRNATLFKATVFFLACFVINLLPVIHGIGGIFGPVTIAGQLQYYVDALLALGVAAGLASSSWLRDQPSLAMHHRSARGQSVSPPEHLSDRIARPTSVITAGVCAAIVVIHGIALPYGLSSVQSANSNNLVNRNWVSSLRASLRSLNESRSHATVIPLTLRADFVPGFEAPFNLESPFLQLLPEWHPSDRGPVEIIGPKGSLLHSRAEGSETLRGPEIRAGHLSPFRLAVASSPSGATCFRGSNNDGGLIISLPTVIRGSVLAMDIHLKVDRSFMAYPLTIYGKDVVFNEVPVTVSPSEMRLVVAFRGQAAQAVGFSGISANASFCISSVQVGQIIVRNGRDSSCSAIDSYGGFLSGVPCDKPWQ